MRHALIGIALISLATSAAAAPNKPGPPVTEPVDTNVINTPGVVIVNTPAEPVPVAVQPGAKLVRIVLSGSRNCASQNCGYSIETVDYEAPEGKILLVDEVSVRQIINPQSGFAQLNTTDFGEFIHFTVIDGLTVVGDDAFAARSMNTYGRRVAVSVTFDQIPTNLVVITATITGRLIDEIEEELIVCNPDCG
jgi:hypothetical protein